MATAISNKPVATLRERGGLKATIWKNSSTKGTFYSIEISRTYRTDDGYRDTRSFSDSDLLIVSRLAQRAYDKVGELIGKDAADRRAAEQQPAPEQVAV